MKRRGLDVPMQFARRDEHISTVVPVLGIFDLTPRPHRIYKQLVRSLLDLQYRRRTSAARRAASLHWSLRKNVGFG